MTGQVFISYSRRDAAAMRRIVVFLRKKGINVWVDNEKLVPGTPIWEEEIEKAIRSSSAVVVVLSPDAKKSVWVRREISLSEHHQKRLFPIMVAGDEDSSLTLRLITSQYVDIRENEETGLIALNTALSFYLEELDLQEKAARERVNHEVVEKAAREKAGREAGEKEARDEAERKATEKASKEKSNKEIEKKLIREKAKREVAEKVPNGIAERQESERTEREKAKAIDVKKMRSKKKNQL